MGRAYALAESEVPRAWEIGSEAAEFRAALLSLGGALAGALPNPRGADLAATVRDLQTRLFRIAIVGRPGSGASALAAVLGLRPGLLPREMPEKSAMVLRLHFGRPGGPRTGGFAHFFDQELWSEIPRDPGRLAGPMGVAAREALALKLKRHVEEMRTRAFMRFGDGFTPLLGETQRIDEVTGLGLCRYLGLDPAESASRSNLPSERGRYADLTREIELFLEPGPFALPVSLVVTPGVDPAFPVRDERTSGCLADADLCIAVLSGDAPLAEEDRRLIERLFERTGGRLVVMLDCCGAATNRRADPRMLHRAVSAHCARLDPSAPPAVAIGSASAAAVALDRLAMAETDADAQEARRAIAASGLPSLAATIGERLFWQSALPAEAAIAADLVAGGRRALASLEREIANLTKKSTPAPDTEEGQAWQADLCTRLSQIEAEARGLLEPRLSGLWAQLRSEAINNLRAVVKETAAAARAAAGSLPLSVALRSALEDILRRHRSGLSEAVQDARDRMSRLIAEVGAEPPRGQVAGGLPIDLDAALVPLADLDRHEAVRRLNMGLSGGSEEGQRQAMGPALAALEKVVEQTTLALSMAVREALAAHRESHEAALAEHQNAAGKSGRVTMLEEARAVCRPLIDQIAAFSRTAEAALSEKR
ncbi:MAG: hypothetical protein ACFBRM_02590 [Pikeienuella sp.]